MTPLSPALSARGDRRPILALAFLSLFLPGTQSTQAADGKTDKTTKPRQRSTSVIWKGVAHEPPGSPACKNRDNSSVFHSAESNTCGRSTVQSRLDPGRIC